MKQLFEFPRVSELVKGQGRVSTEKVYTHSSESVVRWNFAFPCVVFTSNSP